VGGIVVALVSLGAVISYLWLPHDPDASDFLMRFAAPSKEHLLGTDSFGRDLAARILVGARSALWVGLVAVGIGFGIGTIVGVIAGYLSGRLARVLMFVMDSLYSIPALLLALLFAAAFGPGAIGAMIAVGIWAIPVFARLARAGTLAVKSLPYIEASQALGGSHTRIMLRHIFPNVLGPLIVQASLIMAIAILIEAALSYLGLGIQPPTASWGRMLRDAQGFLHFSPYPTIFPGLAIVFTVLGFNLFGDGLRDVLDPTRRTK